MRTFRLPATTLLIMGIAMLSVGCATKRAATPDPAPTTEAPAPPADPTAGAGLESAPTGASADVGAAGPQGEMLSRRVVYFEFDRAEIRAADAPLVAAHAAYLAANPGVRVRLEGHTDERGTREYNIGLGERRGQTVRRAFALQGASEGQLGTVSFGEERPAAAGEDEAAYSQNRRVEILYLN